ncbi:MAG: hypothetical protein AAB586_00365 [Patescibacteria group bacterium]
MKKIFTVLFICLLTLNEANTAFAAILNPYVVDDKLPRLFGDSALLPDHYGLENYAVDYVNGYIHISFTYTHASCCFAGYPPQLYITNVDPRATSTPVIKSSATIYTLLPKPIPPGHPTDWYNYDIQFDATGYSLIIKQANITKIENTYRTIIGLTDSDWVALANLYPMFNPPISFSVALAPEPIRETVSPPEPQTINPVIIVPGIMGSAYKNNELVIDPILHTYDDLIATLAANGYVEGKDLFTFPYEWRDSNVFNANLLDDKIEQIKVICECEKVDIVAHSMGGLVARVYIQSADYDNDVDQVIFLGTPHKGAPKAYLQWEAGEFEPGLDSILTGLFFEAEALRNGYSTIFNYIHSRPILSVQELLPVFDYIKDDSTGIMRQYSSNYPQNFFLKSLNNNLSSLLNSGVEITNIIGNSGEDKTINVIRVIPTDHQVFWEHGEPEGFGAIIGDSGLERGIGDNTVPHLGSSLNRVSNEEIIASHNRIPTVAETKVFNILTGKTASTTFDHQYGVDKKVLLLQLLSPIDVVVTAPDGKKIGKNFSNATEYDEIPDAFYSGFGTDNEYITISTPLDGEYKIEVQGTGNGGEYGVLASYISDEIATTTEVLGITLPDQITNISVDVDNENPEALSTEREITLEVLANDINGAYDLGWIKDKKTRDELIKKVQKIYKNAKTMNKNLAKALELDLKLYRKEKINEQAYNIIKEDLEWLINN